MHEYKLLLPNIGKIKELHNINVEIIIYCLKQNNLYKSYPSNIQIISQEQLYVDIFSSHGQSSLDQEEPQGWEYPLSVFAADIWTSEQHIRLANQPKLNIAHKYPSLSKYIVLGCRL